MDLSNIVDSKFNELEKELLKFQKEIRYPKLSEIASEELQHNIKSQIEKEKGNVYCLFKKDNDSEDIIPVYIGQRESKYLIKRLIEHLAYKSESTASKLTKVLEVINNGGKIFINTVFIEPEYLRHSLEKSIIGKNDSLFKWNNHRS